MLKLHHFYTLRPYFMLLTNMYFHYLPGIEPSCSITQTSSLQAPPLNLNFIHYLDYLWNKSRTYPWLPTCWTMPRPLNLWCARSRARPWSRSCSGTWRWNLLSAKNRSKIKSYRKSNKTQWMNCKVQRLIVIEEK